MSSMKHFCSFSDRRLGKETGSLSRNLAPSLKLTTINKTVLLVERVTSLRCFEKKHHYNYLWGAGIFVRKDPVGLKW
jgi:hypothetical protein